MIWLLLACAGSPAACETDSTGARPTWTSFGQAFFTTWCQPCHASAAPNRFGAPSEVVFDTEADVIAHLDRVRATAVDGETMPPGGGLPDEERAALGAYLDCLEAER